MSMTLTPDATLPDSVDRLAASVAAVVTRRHAGAGLLWRPGVVLTSAALLWRTSWRHGRVGLVLPGGEEVSGELRGLDPVTDLAAVTFTETSPPVPARADQPPRVGDFVFAVGREASGRVQASFGHIGAVGGEWRSWRGGRIDSLIRLDGGLYPGFDGAPVADAQGRVLGLASSAFSRHHGVVLPAATLDRVLDALLAHGRVPQGYLGIAAQPARTQLDGQPRAGLLVSSVAEDGPAARGGLLVGDVIVRIGEQPVADLDDLRSGLQPGAQVALQVVRGGQAVSLTLEVAERPASRCG